MITSLTGISSLRSDIPSRLRRALQIKRKKHHRVITSKSSKLCSWFYFLSLLQKILNLQRPLFMCKEMLRLDMKRILIIIATLFVTVGASAQIQKNFFGLELGKEYDSNPVLLCYISQAEKTPHRNGQRFTDYTFPLKGDVEQIEILEFYINPDNGKEYPTDTTIIKFNVQQKRRCDLYMAIC